MHARVVIVEPSPRGEPERELVVEPLDRRVVLDDAERRTRADDGVGPEPGVEEQLAGMVLVPARPLDAAEPLEALGVDAAILFSDILVVAEAMVMPRSRSRSIESSTCASVISRGCSAPVSSRKRSASVDFPWSMWAMMEKLRMCWFATGIGGRAL